MTQEELKTQKSEKMEKTVRAKMQEVMNLFTEEAEMNDNNHCLICLIAERHENKVASAHIQGGGKQLLLKALIHAMKQNEDLKDLILFVALAFVEQEQTEEEE